MSSDACQRRPRYFHHPNELSFISLHPLNQSIFNEWGIGVRQFSALNKTFKAGAELQYLTSNSLFKNQDVLRGAFLMNVNFLSGFYSEIGLNLTNSISSSRSEQVNPISYQAAFGCQLYMNKKTKIDVQLRSFNPLESKSVQFGFGLVHLY